MASGSRKGTGKVQPLTLSEQRQFNDQSWNWAIETGRENLGNLQVNIQFLKRTGLLRAGLKVLELGCGAGMLTQYLFERGLEVAGSDISQVAIEHARRKYPHLNLTVQSAEKLSAADGQYDVIVSFDVLEHLFDPDAHLAEVWRALRPGGWYLLETPNKWFNQIFETLSTRSLRWKKYHPSLHSVGQLRRRLIGHGFEPRFIKMNTVNEFTLKKLQKFGPLHGLFKRMDFSRLPLGWQTNLYVVAKKGDMIIK